MNRSVFDELTEETKGLYFCIACKFAPTRYRTELKDSLCLNQNNYTGRDLITSDRLFKLTLIQARTDELACGQSGKWYEAIPAKTTTTISEEITATKQRPKVAGLDLGMD